MKHMITAYDMFIKGERFPHPLLGTTALSHVVGQRRWSQPLISL